ncbi:TIGR02391 family protein [Methyloversatilis discipulorum]|uniref:TIGR02391 family protein n=1 Tax=Methyloversatilis discipulorum TaxID=1119528 RepID=UPI0009DB9F9A|nr:TIGR02391 family protein [Methyloversatilis discipulorum]
MATQFEKFEAIVRRANAFDERDVQESSTQHPFDRRNVHELLPEKVRNLFDDGHYAEATFEAFKFLDKVVQKHSKLSESGVKLMMQAFNETKPAVRLTSLSNASEIDEQKGYSFLFSGAVMAIRNPRGHEVNVSDDPDACLDHLAFASLLLRRLEQSGFV